MEKIGGMNSQSTTTTNCSNLEDIHTMTIDDKSCLLHLIAWLASHVMCFLVHRGRLYNCWNCFNQDSLSLTPPFCFFVVIHRLTDKESVKTYTPPVPRSTQQEVTKAIAARPSLSSFLERDEKDSLPSLSLFRVFELFERTVSSIASTNDDDSLHLFEMR